jgi:hypothetical protein
MCNNSFQYPAILYTDIRLLKILQKNKYVSPEDNLPHGVVSTAMMLCAPKIRKFFLEVFPGGLSLLTGNQSAIA